MDGSEGRLCTLLTALPCVVREAAGTRERSRAREGEIGSEVRKGQVLRYGKEGEMRQRGSRG